MVVALTALVGALLASSAFSQTIEDEADITVHGFAGGAVSTATQSEVGMTPFALLYVNAPVGETEESMWPSLTSTLALLKLPGESEVTTVGDLNQFRSLEFAVGLTQPVVKSHRLNLGVEAGFATRLSSGDQTPRDETARYANVNVRFRAVKGFLAIGIGADQRLTGEYRPAVTVTGAVQIKRLTDKSRMMGIISSIHGIDAPTYRNTASAKTRDVVRIAIAIGI